MAPIQDRLISLTLFGKSKIQLGNLQMTKPDRKKDYKVFECFSQFSDLQGW